MKGASFMAKNKDNASPAPEQTTPVKDYQQEEDSESKGKKIRKILFIIILCIVIFFVILAIWWVNEHRVKEVNYDVNGRAQEVFAPGEESSEKTIQVKGSLLDLTGPTVDVVVPVEYFQGKAPSELTAAEKNGGYVALKNDGSNVVYTLRTSFYPSIVANMYEYYCDSFNDRYERKNRVELVSMNRAAQVFTITIEKLNFNANNYRDMLKDLYYEAAIYQCFYGYKPADIKVRFDFKYHQEQFTFKSYNFPENLNKALD